MKDKDLKDELKDSILQRGEKPVQYEPPHGYFDQMQDSVLNKVTKSLTGKNKTKKSLLKNNKWILGIAASVCIVTVSIIALRTTSSTTNWLNNLSDQELFSYVELNIDEFDEDALAYNLDIESLISSEVHIEEDIEDYLQDQIDDLDIEEIEDLL